MVDPTRADRCGVWLGQEATHRRQRAVQLGCGQATGAWDLGRGSHRMSGQDNYKWIALSNTTIGLLMVTISSTITLISLPQIFNGIGLDPLSPGNTSYFLWLLMGFILVTSVLVVSLGRVGDMFGRVRVYNLGFAIFTVFSILLSVTWMTGRAAALWLVVMRIGQGVGGACLTANSSAILTDAFPINQRGLALGINGVVGIGGSFIGLLLGGLLAPVNWRLVFVVCVPFGVFGTVWAYLKLVDTGVRKPARLDWWGNVTFAVGLISLLTGIVYGIQPYGGDAMGWRNPAVIGAIVGGVVMLAVFVRIEQTVGNPMFNIPLFRIPAFTAGNIANLMASLGRGGLQFMLILWLQGIWLPQHGYSFAQTPLWAGIYLVPLTVGFFLAGPVSGALSDRYGPWAFATSGMVGTAAAFLLLALLPVDFSYVSFALVLLLMGIAQGLFSTPNRTAVMNSLPAERPRRRAGHVRHLSELRPSAVHRGVLHRGHHRAGLHAAPHSLRRAHSPRRARHRRPPGRQRAAHRGVVRLLPRPQPREDPGPTSRAGPPQRRPAGHPHRPGLLPVADQHSLRHRPRLRLRLRRGLLHRRRPGLCPAPPVHRHHA